MSTRSISAGMPLPASMRLACTTARPGCIRVPRSSFAEHDQPGEADRERDLADRNAQAAEADRREAAADIGELAPDPSTGAGQARPPGVDSGGRVLHNLVEGC